ncbi:MAG: Fic family protein [bacterium]|nr:Fic family protein [bacterium]
MLESARPRDRSEEEIRNYRDALALIHTEAASGCPEGLPVTSEIFRRLHGIVQGGSGDAGQWKAADNEIVEFTDAGPRIRFRPVAASATPAAASELCDAYHRSVREERLPPLIASACLVLDFLCIHPFRDGNGRVSRLLTLLVLYQHGYEVGRYISLERLIEESREEYYEALRQTSAGWHESAHDLEPWLGFFLTVLRRAYRQFEERAEELTETRGTKTAQIEMAIADLGTEFTFSDLVVACPGVSRDLIRRVLQNLRKAGRLESLGLGRAARWRKRGKERGYKEGNERG